MKDVDRSLPHLIGNGVLAVFLAILALIALYPFVYMLLLSFTDNDSLYLHLKDIVADLHNYEDVFQRINFGNALKNSVLVSVVTCVLNCILCAMAAYGLEKKRFTGSRAVFAIYLATLAVPGQVTMIPVFLMMKDMGLLNSYVALILPSCDAFGVFLIKQFMTSVPDTLLEAADIDGAGEIYKFTRITVPLITPALVSLTVFTFISSWNAFLWPLVICTDSSMQTLTVALSLLKGRFETNYGLVMAGSTMTFLIPFILYICLQKQFVEGIALSGTKE